MPSIGASRKDIERQLSLVRQGKEVIGRMEATRADASGAELAAARQPPSPPEAPSAVKPPSPSPYRRRTFTFVAVLIAVLVIWEGSSFFFAYTDDAVLTSGLVSIAPQITGPVLMVRVQDDQPVAAGTLLFTIDPTPFQLELDQENDEVARAQAQTALDQTGLKTALALQAAAVARAQLAESDLRRATDLTTSGFESSQAQQDAATAASRAADTLAASQAAVLRAQQTIRVDQIAVGAAASARALAEWRLGHTRVFAPVAGRITHFSLLPGDTAIAGTPLVALVASHGWYVVANYKEGVIRHLKPGALGWVWLDTHPFRLYRARIQGVAGGIDRSRTPLGLLPYVDPTVDWIRLQARFPVRFTLLDPPPEAELFMGSDAHTLVFY
jgi:multidrug resistance efflux pump